MPPLVSVVIPTHNRLVYLAEAIASVQAQTYPRWEALIVDDGSTDGTADYLQQLTSPFRVVRWAENRERAAARNAGLQLARGAYVAFLDSDDGWSPTKLADDVALLTSRPAVGWVYGPAVWSNAQGATVRQQTLRLPEGEILRALWRSYFIPNSSTTVRRELALQLGGFNEDRALSGSEDWECWMRLAAAAPAGCVRQRNVHVRVHTQNTMHNPAHMERAMLRALHLVLENPALMARLRPWRAQGEAAMYLHIAVAYAARGDVAMARHWLQRARAVSPAVVWRSAFVKTWCRNAWPVRLRAASAMVSS